MSRRRNEEYEAVPVSHEIGGRALSFVMATIILVAGIAAAAYFMMSPPPSGNVEYGNSGTSGSGGGGSNTNTNPIAIIKVKSEDGSIDGTIKIELYRDKAPITVSNFIKYAKNSLYDGTLFHRVEKDFVIQGGGYYPNGTHITTYQSIVSEADNGLNNTMWTVAMALGSDKNGSTDVNSATSEFFINMNDNTRLDSMGFTVFAKVIDGFDVLEKINEVDTTQINEQFHVPNANIVIVSVTIQGA